MQTNKALKSFDSMPKTRRTGMADPKQVTAVIHCYKCAKTQKELSWERVSPISFSDRMSLKASATSSGKPPEIYDASMETYCGLCCHRAAEMNDEDVNDGEELEDCAKTMLCNGKEFESGKIQTEGPTRARGRTEEN